MSDVTKILDAIEHGDEHAAGRLLPLVYDELRRLAAQKLNREAPGQTLSPTALVHEAYVRLVDNDTEPHWDSRGHFFGAAAEAMRRILVENARRNAAASMGESWCAATWMKSHFRFPSVRRIFWPSTSALDKLAARDKAKADLVKLRYFAGLTIDQAARALGISATTADRHWAYARAWLHQEISGGSRPSVERRGTY